MRHVSFALAVAVAGVLAAPSCSPTADDEPGTDVPRDGTDDGSGDVPTACDPAACDAFCLGGGALGGVCRSNFCTCLGGADADADGDADADADADADTADAVDASRTYTCLEGCRNGSEVCDDQGFTVPSPYVPMALVCMSGRGGTIYVSRNTGPPCTDGVTRCQGWEQAGLNAWDYLDYVVQFPCTEDGVTHNIDLSAYAGTGLHVGVHDDPAIGRDTMMTEVCIATWD